MFWEIFMEGILT